MQTETPVAGVFIAFVFITILLVWRHSLGAVILSVTLLGSLSLYVIAMTTALHERGITGWQQFMAKAVALFFVSLYLGAVLMGPQRVRHVYNRLMT